MARTAQNRVPLIDLNEHAGLLAGRGVGGSVAAAGPRAAHLRRSSGRCRCRQRFPLTRLSQHGCAGASRCCRWRSARRDCRSTRCCAPRSQCRRAAITTARSPDYRRCAAPPPDTGSGAGYRPGPVRSSADPAASAAVRAPAGNRRRRRDPVSELGQLPPPTSACWEYERVRRQHQPGPGSAAAALRSGDPARHRVRRPGRHPHAPAGHRPDLRQQR